MTRYRKVFNCTVLNCKGFSLSASPISQDLKDYNKGNELGLFPLPSVQKELQEESSERQGKEKAKKLTIELLCSMSKKELLVLAKERRLKNERHNRS